MSPVELLKASKKRGLGWGWREEEKKGDTLRSSDLALVTEIKVLLALNLSYGRNPKPLLPACLCTEALCTGLRDAYSYLLVNISFSILLVSSSFPSHLHTHLPQHLHSP